MMLSFYRLTGTSRSNHFAPDDSKAVLKQAFQIPLKEEGAIYLFIIFLIAQPVFFSRGLTTASLKGSGTMPD